MLKFNSILLIVLILQSFALAAKDSNAPLVAFELEVQQNTLDGCTDCRCRVSDELIPGKEGSWWAAFGLARAGEDEPWIAAGAPGHCGSGTFEDVSADFRRTIGNPYVIVDLDTRASMGKKGKISLETEFTIRKLSGFDRKGELEFSSNRQRRTFHFENEGEFTLPLFLPDSEERDAFGIHDVLLRINAVSLERKKAVAFGTVSVTGDVPGAAVLLDGGLVGRLTGSEPLIIKNVLSGKREIRLRDYSGREAIGRVNVREGKTAELVLNVLDLETAAADGDLISIGNNPQGHSEYWRVRDGAMVVQVPAGKFLMGSAEGVGEPNERPQHEVDLPAFMIDKNEVTWRQFLKFAVAEDEVHPPTPVWGKLENYPISFVLFEEAKAYCEWAGARLPTEAEWEKAARGTDGRVYPWGDKWDSSRCNTISGGMHRPEPAGSLPACVSPYGVLDMVGSVQEWTSDQYRDYPYTMEQHFDSAASRSSSYIMRGGGWMSQPSWTRISFRHKRSSTSRLMDHGFRCAQDVPEAAK
jgi:formylglycine-generating enzyme required for sulfatase activity